MTVGIISNKSYVDRPRFELNIPGLKIRNLPRYLPGETSIRNQPLYLPGEINIPFRAKQENERFAYIVFFKAILHMCTLCISESVYKIIEKTQYCESLYVIIFSSWCMLLLFLYRIMVCQEFKEIARNQEIIRKWHFLVLQNLCK